MDVSVLCRALLGVVFLVAAASKLARQSAFAAFVESVRGMSPIGLRAGQARTAGWIVVTVEAAVPPLLAMRPTARLGFIVALALLGAFTGGIVVALVRHRAANCRCFGTSTPLGLPHLLRNILLIIAAVVGVAAAGQPPAGHSGGFTVAIGVGFAVLAVGLDDLIDLFGKPTRPAAVERDRISS